MTHMVAVGTIISDRPPHRIVRALLRTRLLSWMISKESRYRIRMQNAWDSNPNTIADIFLLTSQAKCTRHRAACHGFSEGNRAAGLLLGF